MKIVLKSLIIVAIASACSFGAIHLYENCPKRKENLKEEINNQINSYIENNSNVILEKMAKNDRFRNTVKSLSSIGDENISAIVDEYFQNNPQTLENYIRDNASFIASTILETEEFSNVSIEKSDKTEETSNDNKQPSENPNQKYIDNWEKLSNSDVAPYIGPKDAKIRVVEFFDFNCGHCKATAPIVSAVAKNNPDVKFVFNPLYFMSEHSPYAAKVAMAAHKKGKFIEVYDGIMTLPSMNKETINQILKDEGLDVEEINKMIEEKDIRRGSQDIDALSQVLGINGVPMFFINGEPFYGRSFDEFQNKINSLR